MAYEVHHVAEDAGVLRRPCCHNTKLVFPLSDAGESSNVTGFGQPRVSQARGSKSEVDVVLCFESHASLRRYSEVDVVEADEARERRLVPTLVPDGEWREEPDRVLAEPEVLRAFASGRSPGSLNSSCV